jgi:hypothetical protein
VNLILTAIGLLLLLPCLAAIFFGVFMAMDSKNRDAGRFFAVWWVPGAAAATGVLMRDVVTFVVGTLCFLVAGVAFALGSETYGKPSVKRTRRDNSGKPPPSTREMGILGEENGQADARTRELPGREERS